MDYARCLLDDEIYPALVFSQLPFSEREDKRQHLICPNDSCKGPAFYRRESTLGQAACFGARHVDGCNQAAGDSTRIPGGEGDEEDYRLNPGEVLKLDLGYGAHERVNIDVTEEGKLEGRHRASRYVGDGARATATKHQRLQPLLRTLINYPAYAEQDVQVIIPDRRGSTSARELFVPFERANEVDIPKFYALWGLIASARTDNKGTMWLNAGGAASVSFPMNADLQNSLQERLEVSADDLSEALAGCYLLVLGTLGRGGPKNKLFCSPATALHFAVIRA